MFGSFSLIIISLILLLAAIFLFKQLISHVSDNNEETFVRKLGQPATPVQTIITEPSAQLYGQTGPIIRTNRGNKKFMFSLTLLACLGYLAYDNRALIEKKLTFSATVQASSQQIPLPFTTIGGHRVVDGINWFKIVATSTEGIPFEGWVSEMAIQSQPPEENKLADELMQKLGLPTNRERIDSIKKIKNINQALDTALESTRTPGN
ncbi:MAG: hypothetical protein PHV05_00990 [Candidatus Riflebacteria bacterium]|nr:hypothetical protein [Candidatus Riflebacteria bacterium]